MYVTFTQSNVYLMELIIEGPTSLQSEGTVTVDLPDYFIFLSDKELDAAKRADNCQDRAVAAGKHPETGDIVFLTATGELYEVDLTRFEFPATVSMFPKNVGEDISIVLKDFESIDVSTAWAKRVGKLMINLGTLADKRGARVTYVDCEDNNKETTSNNP